MKERTSVERRIARLTREIAEIDDLSDWDDREDRRTVAFMLERKRGDRVRATVLQLHTSIEDLLNFCISARLLGRTGYGRGERGRALRKLLLDRDSVGFDAKLNLAVAVGVLTKPFRAKLMELNTIRNKCGHNWRLGVPVRRGKRPRQKKPPLLLFRGHDLHKVGILKEFWGEYLLLYLKIWWGSANDRWPIGIRSFPRGLQDPLQPTGDH